MDSEAAQTPAHLLVQEHGLKRQLTERQLTMIAIGGAIGTGLFLGSGVAIQIAGPGVLFTYGLGAIIALIVTLALSEMAVLRPLAGSFGVHADEFLHPWAGFSVRYSYWLAQVIAIGSEVVAAAIYCQYWFPHVPQWIWIVVFSGTMVYVNSRTVARFGEFEYWFAMIKVVVIVAFLVVGLGLIFSGNRTVGLTFKELADRSKLLPHGWSGVWLASSLVMFSFLGVEIVAVTSGEAQDPGTVIPKAMKGTLARLVLFYLGAIFILVMVVPHAIIGIRESPFVTVFRAVRVPFAAALMNFVVLTAALSSMNTNLYLTSRMLFSLSRSGFAPRFLGIVSPTGAPRNALLASTGGLAAAIFMARFFPARAYLSMVGVALFGGVFAWMVILATHFAFRRRMPRSTIASLPLRLPLAPWTTGLALLLLIAITISSAWTVDMRPMAASAIPWLVAVTVFYWLWKRFWKRG
ncbi:MAG: amino acid permease [Acidobacteriia bacterium]|nr:amino acid permease [Terriglobia bacterium]